MDIFLCNKSAVAKETASEYMSQRPQQIAVHQYETKKPQQTEQKCDPSIMTKRELALTDRLIGDRCTKTTDRPLSNRY